MKLLVVALALGTVAANPAGASDASPAKVPLQLRPKAAITVATPSRYQAPYLNPMVSEPDLDLLPREDARQQMSRSSCSGDRSLCYDPTSGRIVYKPARQLMPDLPGLQRENISVKRDRIVFRYSF